MNYWSEPGATTLPRVQELANWLVNEGYCGENVTYGELSLMNVIRKFDPTPGAFITLVTSGHLIRATAYVAGNWYTFHQFPRYDVLRNKFY